MVEKCIVYMHITAELNICWLTCLLFISIITCTICIRTSHFTGQCISVIYMHIGYYVTMACILNLAGIFVYLCFFLI